MYRIQITQETRVTRTKDEWKVVADSGNDKDGGRVYDYVPHQVERTETSEILDMRVEELNVPKVINAILGGTKP